MKRLKGYTILRANCKVCGKRAAIRVYYRDDGEMFPDSSESFCSDHIPQEVERDITLMNQAVITPPGL